MVEFLKKLISFTIALAISYIIFYSFFAMLGLTFRLIMSLFHIILIILVALPFYVILKKKIFK